MKIKCPVGGCDMEFDISNDDLYHHFLDDPHLMNFKYFYWELYKKIHEKIEDFRKKEFEIRKGYGYNDPEANRLNLMIKELKSLLENK
jgi:hypothetical protein